MKDSMGMVPPPQTQTVKKTIRRVVENIICRAYVAVSRMESANVIAPRRPVGDRQNRTAYYKNIFITRSCTFVSKLTYGSYVLLWVQTLKHLQRHLGDFYY